LKSLGRTFLDGAEAAAPGAGISEDQEGGCLGRPAFADIGTLGALADRPEAIFLQDLRYLKKVVMGGEPDLQPRRFGRTSGPIGRKGRSIVIVERLDV
jgi:hypothetical protein